MKQQTLSFMENEAKTEVVTENDNTGEVENGSESISIPKSDYEKLNQTLGSLKRELKDLKKPKEEPKETSTKSDENRLIEKLEKMAFRQAGITHQDDVDLARTIAKKWNMDVEDVLGDEDFKLKLDRQQTSRSNVAATSGIKGGGGTTQAKSTAEYWIAKGIPPSVADVPDRKLRAKISRTMMSSAKSGKKFYND